MCCLVSGSWVSCLPVVRFAVEQRACVLGIWVFFFPLSLAHTSVCCLLEDLQSCKRALRRKTGVIVAVVICDGLVVGSF